MTTTKRQIALTLFFVFSLLTEQFIWYLFPFTGLGGLICWPSAFILASCSTYLLYRLIKKESSKILLVGISFTLFILQFIFLLYIHPQDYGGEPIDQLKQYSKTYRNYNQVNFDKFDSLNNADRVAFMYKYKNKLPKSISTLYIDTLISSYTNQYARQYTIYNYDNSTIYDTSKLKVLQTDTSTFVQELLNNNAKHKLYKGFINDNGVGFSDTLNKCQYNISKDSFDLKSGAEKIFYNLLSWTKKASR
ncbi:hypothetical protein [Ferruginibacter profundus]